MRNHFHRPRLRALLIMTALLAAACGGDDGGGPASGTDAAADDVDVASEDASSQAPSAGERCDLGFNTETYNEEAELVDQANHVGHEEAHGSEEGPPYTIEEWAEEFAFDEGGLDSESLAELVVDTPQLHEAVTGGGLTPTLDPDPWIPMTDPETCEALADELRQTRDAAAQLPTVADAEAAGYEGGSRAAPGQGAHYTNIDLMAEEFSADEPQQLMYTGNDADDSLIGLSFYVRGDDGEPPDGFVGDNDRWHHHANLCQDDEGRAIGGDTTREKCEEELGGHFQELGDFWMLHVWVVPGCESDWGMFSGANPRFPVVPPDAEFDAGCNTGRSPADSLELDDPGDGPTVSG